MPDDTEPTTPLEHDPERPVPQVASEEPTTTTEHASIDDGHADSLADNLAEVDADEPIAGTQPPDDGENATAGAPNSPPDAINPQPNNFSPDDPSDATTHVNEDLISRGEDGKPDIDSLWATENDRLKRTAKSNDLTAETEGVTYAGGTDPTTVNVLGEKSLANPDIVTPERGKPIPHTENRSVPEELVDRAKPYGEGAAIVRKRNEYGDEIDNDGNLVEPADSYKPGYTPQPQTPDPLANEGILRVQAAGFAKTLPPGAIEQPGAPVYPPAKADEGEDDLAFSSTLADHLTVGSGDERSSVSWPAEHRGVSGLRTLAGRSYLASEPTPGATPPARTVRPREAIPQTPWGDARGVAVAERPTVGEMAEDEREDDAAEAEQEALDRQEQATAPND